MWSGRLTANEMSGTSTGVTGNWQTDGTISWTDTYSGSNTYPANGGNLFITLYSGSAPLVSELIIRKSGNILLGTQMKR